LRKTKSVLHKVRSNRREHIFACERARECAVRLQYMHIPHCACGSAGISVKFARTLCGELETRSKAVSKRSDVKMPATDGMSPEAEGRPSLRADFRAIQMLYGDRRPADRLIAHYEIEVVLAEKLRRSTRENRRSTYREVYSELLKKVSDHPRITRAHDARRTDIRKRSRFVRRFIAPNDRVVEIGAGDAALSRNICDRAHSVVAVDVDDALIGTELAPPNFRYELSDGVSLPLPDESTTLAISNQLLEHIHPDDTMPHLREVHRILAVGGRYLIMTPNLVSGPHDISRYFDRRARGTHLREFDAETIRNCLRAAGFERLVFYAARGGYLFFPMPYWLARGFDLVFSLVPSSLHTPLVRNKLTSTLLGMNVVAYK
jgi:SAM-dependent methyltransferase